MLRKLFDKVFSKWMVLIFTILFWGLAFTAIKYSVGYLTPVELAALRFAIADLFFLAGIVLTGIKVDKQLPSDFCAGHLWGGNLACSPECRGDFHKLRCYEPHNFYSPHLRSPVFMGLFEGENYEVEGAWNVDSLCWRCCTI